jgi:hypothetical protein
MASKEFILELKEMSTGELWLATMLMNGKPLATLLEHTDETMELHSDFSGIIVGGNPEMEYAVLDEAKKMLEIEYPEVYELLKVLHGNDADIIPF